jgi:hypothetical protein
MTTEFKRMQQLRGTRQEWQADNIVPLEGEMALEVTNSAAGVKVKVGDGYTPFSGLPYLFGGDIYGGTGLLVTKHEETATAGQTEFVPPAAYLVGFADVYVNGVMLSAAEFTATDGLTITLAQPAQAGDIVAIIAYQASPTTGIAPGSIVDIYGPAVDKAASQRLVTDSVSFIQSGDDAVTRTARDKMREWVSVADFGAVGDGVTDDIAAINAAIASFPASGGLLRLLQRHAISSTIVIAKPVRVEGLVEGSAFQPVQPAGTELVWIGGVFNGAMMRVGLSGVGTNTLWGGGVSNLRFNGGGQCAYGLQVSDASHGEYRNLYIWNVTGAGLRLTSDGTKINMPSGWNRFYGLFCDMRAALTASANASGVLIDANNGDGSAGVTLNYFEDLKVNHSGGHGVAWLKGGDGMVFMKPQFFRADSETGYSCYFGSTDAADICNHIMFYYPIATGGMYFAKAGLHTGTHIHDYDGQNINAGMGLNLIQGPGASEVKGNSTFGQLFGQSRLWSNQDVMKQDPMVLIRYDATNAIVQTNAGNWKYFASGGNVIESGHVGGGVQIATLAAANDSSLLANGSASSGVALWQYPSAQFLLNLPDNTAMKARWGFLSSNADPASDGMWIEFDPTLSGGQYRCICAKGGNQTVVVNSAGLTGAGNPFLRWRIDVSSGAVNFYVSGIGTPNPQLTTLVASITTNRPDTATMTCGVYVKTTAAAIKRLDLVDFKLAHDLDRR